MQFHDDAHKRRFQELASKAQIRPGEHDYLAALYLLSSPLLDGKSCGSYVEEEKIRFGDLNEASKPWSSGEKALIKLAAALFNSAWKVDINDVFQSLDADNVKVALEALRIRWG